MAKWLAGLGVLTLAAVLLSQTAAPAPLAVRVYNVTDAAAFPPLAGGRVLVFRNGLFQAPGVDYASVSGGTQIRFTAGLLAAGDQIEVVTLP